MKNISINMLLFGICVLCLIGIFFSVGYGAPHYVIYALMVFPIIVFIWGMYNGIKNSFKK